jgi:hypothetical protein
MPRRLPRWGPRCVDFSSAAPLFRSVSLCCHSSFDRVLPFTSQFLKNDDCGVIYGHAAKDYGAMEAAIAALPDVRMIHSVKAPDLGAADAPKVCQFRRVAKDLLDTWPDTMRLLDTANDEAFLSEVGPGFFSDLDMCVCMSIVNVNVNVHVARPSPLPQLSFT